MAGNDAIILEGLHDRYSGTTFKSISRLYFGPECLLEKHCHYLFQSVFMI